ncbi:MAG: hypothetical protein HQL58_07355 [Magnetococcales bacterium]|nr:hypothetical protein [Magnetococcales bacterium]
MNSDQLLQSAMANYHAGRIEAASSQCTELLNASFTNGAAWYLRGLLHHHKGNVLEAAIDLRRALSLIPDHADAWKLLDNISGNASIELGKIGQILVTGVHAWCDRWTDGTIQSGPFRGIERYNNSFVEGVPSYDSIGKLFGWYEAELHPWVEQASHVPYTRVINIGCADGYYAFGLAHLIPTAQVYAFDYDEKAQVVCKQIAVRSGLSHRVHIDGLCTIEHLRQLAVSGAGERTLIFIDCEGCEKELLNPQIVGALAGCDIIVECHDFFDPQITPTLLSRFSASHHIDKVDQGGRNPNAFQDMRYFPEMTRWLMVCENRPVGLIHWMRLQSLQHQQRS